MEVHFVGYLYITDRINARKIELKIIVYCCCDNICMKHNFRNETS